MLGRIRTFFHYRSLKRRMKDNTAFHRAISLHDAQSILIFFNANNKEDFTLIKSYTDQLRRKGKKVEALGYYSHKNVELNILFNYLNQKELRWFHIPSTKHIHAYGMQRFDLLLNLYTDEILPLEYLSSISHSTCRVGRYISGKTYYCDLMISIPENASLKQLIQQTEYYLNQLKPIHNNATI
jgi:hypothetical protein